MKIYREITPLQPQDVFSIYHNPDSFFGYPLHSHPEYEINMISKGKGTRIIGDKVDKYEDTDLALLGPNLHHYWDNSEVDKNIFPTTAVTFIQFEEHLFGNFLHKADFQPIRLMLQYAARGIEFYGQTKIDAMEQMQHLTRLEGFEATLQFLKFLHFLATSEEKRLIASAGYSTKIITKESRRMDEVYQYILQNFHKKMPIKEVAAIANMSESAFSHFFKKSTNRSYMLFVTEIRLRQACQLLTASQLNISEIAFKCGYSNLSNFNRLFKKYKGCTAIEYRNKMEYSVSDFEDRFVEE